MMDWAIGLSTGCFYQTSIFDCLQAIRNSGFTMLEICSSPAHLDYHDSGAVRKAADKMRHLGLEAYSFHAPFAEDIDLTSPSRKQRQESLNEILRAADAAAALEVRHFVFHPGPEKPKDKSRGEIVDRMNYAAEAIHTIAQYCKTRRIAIALENMLPHLLFGNTRDMLWILGTVQDVSPGVCLDTGHAHLSSELDTMVLKLIGHLRMLHANDNRGKEDDHLPPGRGGIDWPRLLSELWRTDFRGSLILELAGNPDISPEVMLAEARGSMLYLRNRARELFVQNLLLAEPQGDRRRSKTERPKTHR